eukprot:c14700_g1_i1 orf=78-317(+)
MKDDMQYTHLQFLQSQEYTVLGTSGELSHEALLCVAPLMAKRVNITSSALKLLLIPYIRISALASFLCDIQDNPCSAPQ